MPGGRPLVYLDSSATSQTPQPVIDAMTRYYTEVRASIHRGVYPLAAQLSSAGVVQDVARTFLPFWPGKRAARTVKPLTVGWVCAWEKQRTIVVSIHPSCIFMQ